MASAQESMNTSSLRYLPTYEDAIAPYSLRLPTYRSSYVRRYHPYARYTTPVVQEQYMDEFDYEEPLLDLSILDRRVETDRGVNQPEQPAEEQLQERHEAPAPLVNLEAMYIDVGVQEDRNEQLDPNAVFIRVDIGSSS